MQTNPPTKVKAIEVLSFSHAELQRNYDGENKISGVGILSVLYFPDYDRFILYLEKWSYALLKRIPVIASGEPFSNSRCYVFPAYKGTYIVKLSKIVYPKAIHNLETILKNNSLFSYDIGQEVSHHRDPSPSDRFIEYEKHGESYREKDAPHVGKLRGKEKIKKGFKKIICKFTSHYSYKHRNTANLSQIMDYNMLKTSGLGFHPVDRKDVETTIVRTKDIAKIRGYLPRNEIASKVTETIKGLYGTVASKTDKEVEEEPKPLTLSEVIMMNELENEKLLEEQERNIQKEGELPSPLRAEHQKHLTHQMEEREGINLTNLG